ncbi:hypothetical protein [Streptomyces sp. NPDC006879]
MLSLRRAVWSCRRAGRVGAVRTGRRVLAAVGH